MFIRKNLATDKFELVQSDDFEGTVILELSLYELDAIASAVLLKEYRVVPNAYPTIN